MPQPSRWSSRASPPSGSSSPASSPCRGRRARTRPSSSRATRSARATRSCRRGGRCSWASAMCWPRGGGRARPAGGRFPYRVPRDRRLGRLGLGRRRGIGWRRRRRPRPGGRRAGRRDRARLPESGRAPAAGARYSARALGRAVLVRRNPASVAASAVLVVAGGLAPLAASLLILTGRVPSRACACGRGRTARAFVLHAVLAFGFALSLGLRLVDAPRAARAQPPRAARSDRRRPPSPSRPSSSSRRSSPSPRARRSSPDTKYWRGLGKHNRDSELGERRRTAAAREVDAEPGDVDEF